ncbi:MAG: hypothetical protein KGQ66_15750 [Acidobacteriota bacterium]|nr:hypothetical protein [Acidobacteriota bacterium]
MSWQSIVQALLQIAAAHGYDCTDPLRAAELLVIRGRHPTVEDASVALPRAQNVEPRARAGDPGPMVVGSCGGLVEVGTGAPAGRICGRSGTRRGRSGQLRSAVRGVPACSYGAARAARRLGRRANEFYSTDRMLSDRSPEFGLPAPPSIRAGLDAVGAVLVTILLGVVLSVLWVGNGHHGLWRIALAVLWALVLGAHIRLVLLLRSVIRPARIAAPGLNILAHGGCGHAIAVG